MRVDREQPRARTAVLALLAVSLVPLLGTTGSPALAALPAAVPGPAVDAPQPVTPTITDAAVPPVTAKDAVTTADGTLAARLRAGLTPDFSMLGVTWDHGSAPAGTVVEVRTKAASGTWGDWTKLEVEPTEGPAPSEDSALRDGTNPVWSGRSTGVEVAVYTSTGKSPTGLAVDEINPGTSPYDQTIGSGAAASSAQQTTALSLAKRGPQAGTFPGMPRIITRQEWGADPSLGDRCWNPRFGDSFKMVFVHHTAGSNNYSEAESPAIVRGIYAFHTQSRGWCDIAYNFLVDKYGNIYEGRAGGIRRPVRGAHAGDFNVDTTGISLMGNFDLAYPSKAMKRALVSLVAWRLGTAYHGAYGHARVYGARFKRISGHRDAMSTSCPGQHAYDWLPRLRHRVGTLLGDYQSKIEQRWRARGAASGRLGNVISGEQGENGGKHTTFEGGRIYHSSQGVFVDYTGPILRRYLKQGETHGPLGYPSSKVWPAAGKGWAQQFAHGRIYFSSQTGSRTILRSPILKKYRELGAAVGQLGFPKTPIFHTSDDVRAAFQGGKIVFDAAARKTTVTYR